MYTQLKANASPWLFLDVKHHHFNKVTSAQVVFLPRHGLVGLSQKKFKWCIKSEVNVPLMVHQFRSDATSKMDL